MNLQTKTDFQISEETLNLMHFPTSNDILNINKPEGWTSFDVVKKIRNIVRVKKVGHAGTLDPFATGVLLVCVGRATKRVPELMHLEKEYVARLKFGMVTDTFDRTGTVQETHDVPNFSVERLVDTCQDFCGEIWQLPPMYSAVKVNGQRLYQLARKGLTVEREPRKITVHNIDVVEFDLPSATLRIRCSKGTYIRSLAHDIGRQLGCGALLDALTRTRIGEYRIEEALTVAQFIQQHNKALQNS